MYMHMCMHTAAESNATDDRLTDGHEDMRMRRRDDPVTFPCDGSGSGVIFHEERTGKLFIYLFGKKTNKLSGLGIGQTNNRLL